MKALAEFFGYDTKTVVIRTFVLLLILVACVFILPKIIGLVLPFILALWLAKLCTPLVSFLKAKLRIPREVASITVILGIIGIFGYALFILTAILLKELYELAQYVPKLLENNNIALSNTYISNLILRLIDKLPESLQGFGEYVMQSVKNYIVSLAEPFTKSIVSFAGNFAGKLPSVAVFLVSLILASYFIMSDSAVVNRILFYVPERIKGWYQTVSKTIKRVFVYYLKSRIIIGIITFLILVTGFLIISVKSPAVIAISFCLADALPVIGLGSVMLPWALWCMIFGAYKRGIGVLLVYLVAIVIRRITEPKIVSRQMGIHPLLTVFFMYAGFKLFSGWGLIFAPVAGTVIINIINSQKYTSINDEVENI